jgi:hypothetical protein
MAMMAIKDPYFRIVDYPMDEARTRLCPFATFKEAEAVLAEARRHKPAVLWKIVGNGPWEVRG